MVILNKDTVNRKQIKEEQENCILTQTTVFTLTRIKFRYSDKKIEKRI